MWVLVGLGGRYGPCENKKKFSWYAMFSVWLILLDPRYVTSVLFAFRSSDLVVGQARIVFCDVSIPRVWEPCPLFLSLLFQNPVNLCSLLSTSSFQRRCHKAVCSHYGPAKPHRGLACPPGERHANFGRGYRQAHFKSGTIHCHFLAN